MNAMSPRDLMTAETFGQWAQQDPKKKDFDCGRIKPREIVYCRRHWREFFETLHPKIPVPYILLSSYHDAELRHVYPGVDDEKLICWFANNVSVKHPKIRLIPRAIKAGHISIIEKVEPRPRTILMYLNFSSNTSERKKALERFSKETYCTIKTWRKDQTNNYFQDLAASVFVLSPAGHGEDCYRTSEALALGAYPIIRKSFLSSYYEDLPVLMVDRFESITEKLLLDTAEQFKNQTFNMAKLYRPYWDKVLKDCA